jgi:ribonuclease E
VPAAVELVAVPESAVAQPAPASAEQPVLVAAPEPVVEQAPADDDGKPKKRGWWSLGR